MFKYTGQFLRKVLGAVIKKKTDSLGLSLNKTCRQYYSVRFVQKKKR